MKYLILCLLLISGSRASWAVVHLSSSSDRAKPNTEAGRRPQGIPDEKSSRTAAQKKIDSQLLYALKQKRGETRGVPTERIKLELDQKGRALVDITAIVGPEVTAKIRKLGGTVISADPFYHTIRARLALEKLEALAALKDVRFIAPPAQAMNNRITPD